MLKKIVRAYLISTIILFLLTLSYSIFLYFSQNDKFLDIITLIIGAIFFLILGILGIKAFNKKIILVGACYFVITYSIFILIFFLSKGNFTSKIYLKGVIYLISTIIGCFIGKK